MFRALLLTALLAAPASAQGELVEEDPVRNQFNRSAYYVENGDATERETAIQALIAMGRPILPFLEAKMSANLGDEVAARYLRVQAAIQRPEFDAPDSIPIASAAANPVESYFLGRFQQAREAYRQGRFDRAIQLVDAILVLEPALPFRQDVLDLREELHRRELLAGKLLPIVRPHHPYVTWGEPVVLDFFLQNVGDGDFAFAAASEDPDGNAQRTTIRVLAEMVQYDLAGSTHSSRLQLSTGIERDVRIHPDERWSGTLEFNPVSEMRPGFVVARIRIESALQIVHVLEGGPIHASGIPFLPVTVTVLHPDYRSAAKDPVGAFFAGIEAGKRREVFLASFLVPRGQLKLVIDRIVDLLPRTPPEMLDVLHAILVRWTEERSNPRSSEFWRQWWAARRESWTPPWDE